MDYYIVRIYRREQGDPDSIVGTIEEASSAERKSFRSPDELWNILGGRGEKIQKKGMACDTEIR
ncbi:MAG: hypothetical protein AABZ15_01545 [Nitrospirota bacterium]